MDLSWHTYPIGRGCIRGCRKASLESSGSRGTAALGTPLQALERLFETLGTGLKMTARGEKMTADVNTMADVDGPCCELAGMTGLRIMPFLFLSLYPLCIACLRHPVGVGGLSAHRYDDVINTRRISGRHWIRGAQELVLGQRAGSGRMGSVRTMTMATSSAACEEEPVEGLTNVFM